MFHQVPPAHSPVKREPGLVLEYTGLVLEYTGLVLEYTGLVLEYTGLVLEYTGFVLEYTGLVLEYTGLVLEYTGLVLEYTGCASLTNGGTLGAHTCSGKHSWYSCELLAWAPGDCIALAHSACLVHRCPGLFEPYGS